MVLLAALATPRLGIAQDLPPPVCARPGVLERVGEILRQKGRPLALEAYPIGEVSTAPGPLVQCAVRGHTIGYDTNRYGLSPVYEPIIVNYTIELRHNGMFVQVQ